MWNIFLYKNCVSLRSHLWCSFVVEQQRYYIFLLLVGFGKSNIRLTEMVVLSRAIMALYLEEAITETFGYRTWLHVSGNSFGWSNATSQCWSVSFLNSHQICGKTGVICAGTQTDCTARLFQFSLFLLSSSLSLLCHVPFYA